VTLETYAIGAEREPGFVAPVCLSLTPIGAPSYFTEKNTQ